MGIMVIAGVIALLIGIILLLAGLISLLFALASKDKNAKTRSLKILMAAGLTLLLSFSLCSLSML